MSHDDARPFPQTWVLAAGAVFGLLTLGFFMYVALHGARDPKALAAVLGLGAGLSAGFIGGHAAMRGRLPLTPIRAGASGGIAAAAIFFLLGIWLFKVPDQVGEPCSEQSIAMSIPAGFNFESLVRTLVTDECGLGVEFEGCSSETLAQELQSGRLEASNLRNALQNIPELWPAGSGPGESSPRPILRVERNTEDDRFTIVCESDS